jgi:hypothetical protein
MCLQKLYLSINEWKKKLAPRFWPPSSLASDVGDFTRFWEACIRVGQPLEMILDIAESSQ